MSCENYSNIEFYYNIKKERELSLKNLDSNSLDYRIIKLDIMNIDTYFMMNKCRECICIECCINKNNQD